MEIDLEGGYIYFRYQKSMKTYARFFSLNMQSCN